ncbi:MAG TPA: TetR family transcriptional regulator [Candidatus Acidoferrales bacterium]|nr:TetR family transcriptional regulator [Candidatus Acidoferrales bacterium]
MSVTASSPHRVPRISRRERHRAEIRERLFDAALQLFAERGYLETTVEDITNAADVGKGTFFNYFPTKEHVLATFGGERIATIARALERARATRGPVLAVIEDLVTHQLGQSWDSPALIRSIYAAHASCAPVRAQLEKRLGEARRLMAEIFLLAQKCGEVRRDLSAADLARSTQIVFHGVLLSWALNPDAPLRDTMAEIWDLFSPTLRAEKRSILRPALSRHGEVTRE